MAIPDGKQDIKSIFIGDRYFEVPNYQRSYAWKEKQLQDFLEDFSNTENYLKYYYGTILLQQKANCEDTYEIVDGQQRITTLIIFMYCLIRKMEEFQKPDNVSVSDTAEMRQKYIRYKTNYILKLQDQDDGFFKSYILGENTNIITKTPAQENLLYAKKYFLNALNGADSNVINEYIKRVKAANCLVYSVSDRNEAAMIFETTNDRGKMLTNLEKTKSFLMYKVSTTFKSSTSLLDTIQQGFNDIYNTYEELKGKPKFNLDENSIQQYMFIAYEAWENRNVKGKTIKVYQHYLDELKETINEKTKAIHDSETDQKKEAPVNELNNYIERYINQLKDSFNAIKGMFDGGDEFYNLLTLNRVASLYPILIKGYSLDASETKSEFKSLCKWCEIFCFRGLTILKYLANKYQDKWYTLARNFIGDYSKLYDEIRDMIMSLGDDDKFIEKLKSKDFFNDYSSQDRNYFFWSYENYLRQPGGYSLLSHADLWQTDSKKKFTIEHIVAQSDETEKCRILKSEKFVKVGQKAHFDKEYLHSIGNLTIDPLSANASKGKKPVDEKNSDYFMTAPLMSQNEMDSFMQSSKWTLKSIDIRKNKLLKFARSKWCFTAPLKVSKIDDDADNNDTELIED